MLWNGFLIMPAGPLARSSFHEPPIADRLPVLLFMSDFIFVAMVVTFFLGSALYVRCCEEF